MKKLVVLGLLLAMSTGCGRGWFPHLFRGAPCNGLCSAPAAPAFDACENCGSAGYAGYEGEGYVGSELAGPMSVGPTYESAPAMQNLPPAGTIIPNKP